MYPDPAVAVLSSNEAGYMQTADKKARVIIVFCIQYREAKHLYMGEVKITPSLGMAGKLNLDTLL